MLNNKDNDLLYESYRAIRENNLKELKRLIANGARINLPVQFSDVDYQFSMLYRSLDNNIDIAMTEYLLQNGADPNRRAHTILGGNTPLHRASYIGANNKVKLLLKYGADMYALNRDRKTPFYIALANNNFGTAVILVLHGYIPSADDFATNYFSLQDNIQEKILWMEFFLHLTKRHQSFSG